VKTYSTRWPWQKEVLAVVMTVAVLALLPFVVTDSYWRHILIVIFIYALVASSWDLTLGYGGIFNFGHLAFFGVGLYCYSVLTTVFSVWPWIAFALAALASCAVAALVSIPILRLKGIYIVLVTFGFSQLIMQLVLSQSALTGGTQGMIRIPMLPVGDHNFVRDGRFGSYYMALALLVAGVAALRVYVRSRFGLSLVALKDTEEYATSRGISAAMQRVLALSFSALLAGCAGAFYGSYARTASVDVFGMSFATLILSMILLGGVGSTYGPIIAAFLLTILSEFLTDAGAFRPMIIALLIIGVMLAFPGGLIGGLKATIGRIGRR
jgi:branched-chain amino acid transport system permease protein